jgi:quinohemoprotein ethanol dehydrogenase
VTISSGNMEYSYGPSRIRIKKGTTVTFTNTGDLPHTATEITQRMWDTGDLVKGASKAITFNELGNYYYICTPHPWMYGQIIVEN